MKFKLLSFLTLFDYFYQKQSSRFQAKSHKLKKLVNGTFNFFKTNLFPFDKNERTAKKCFKNCEKFWNS